MKKLLFMVFIWMVEAVGAQSSIQWLKSLGGSYFDEAASIKQTSDGSYIVTGKSASTDGEVEGNHGGNDFWAIKLSALGSIQWKKTIGGSNNDFRLAWSSMPTPSAKGYQASPPPR